MSSLCVYIAMAKHDSLAIHFFLQSSICKKIRDDVFILWQHDRAFLLFFLGYLTSMDKAGKNNFTMKIASKRRKRNIFLKQK